MSRVYDDFKILKSHYTSRRDWYLAAIERLENDIQKVWNDYFIMKGQQYINTIKIHEVSLAFNALKEASIYFREQLLTIEKRLEELTKQEYALFSKGDSPVN